MMPNTPELPSATCAELRMCTSSLATPDVIVTESFTVLVLCHAVTSLLAHLSSGSFRDSRCHQASNDSTMKLWSKSPVDEMGPLHAPIWA
eukprot:5374907-Amphidinium_carterae.1